MPATPDTLCHRPLRRFACAAALAGAVLFVFPESDAVAGADSFSAAANAFSPALVTPGLFQPIPEPGTLLSILGGTAMLIGWRRWRRS
jgi:hypothetical protein